MTTPRCTDSVRPPRVTSTSAGGVPVRDEGRRRAVPVGLLASLTGWLALALLRTGRLVAALALALAEDAATAGGSTTTLALRLLRAGARAVIADVWNSAVVSHIKSILTTDQTIGNMWTNSVSNHGHQMPFTPARNPAYKAIMDPNTWNSGFYRSIVGALDMSTTAVRAARETSRWEAQRSFDELGRPLRDLTFCVVDLETTGGSAAAGSMITEIGAVKLRGGERTGVFETLVNPGVSIPRQITHLTGIDDLVVAGPG